MGFRPCPVAFDAHGVCCVCVTFVAGMDVILSIWHPFQGSLHHCLWGLTASFWPLDCANVYVPVAVAPHNLSIELVPLLESQRLSPRAWPIHCLPTNSRPCQRRLLKTSSRHSHYTSKPTEKHRHESTLVCLFVLPIWTTVAAQSCVPLWRCKISGNPLLNSQRELLVLSFVPIAKTRKVAFSLHGLPSTAVPWLCHLLHLGHVCSQTACQFGWSFHAVGHFVFVVHLRFSFGQFVGQPTSVRYLH